VSSRSGVGRPACLQAAIRLLYFFLLFYQMSFVDRASRKRSPDDLSWPREETRIKQSRKSTSGEEERNRMMKGGKEGKRKQGTRPPTTDLHIYNLDAVPPIHVVSNHVDTDKLTTANGGSFTSSSASRSSQSR